MTIEPVHDNQARDTSVSNSEGRLKSSIIMHKKKRKLLKNRIKKVCDGRGGSGTIAPKLSKEARGQLLKLGLSFSSKTPSGGTRPIIKKKLKKVSLSGIKSSLNSLLKKKTLKKIVTSKIKKTSIPKMKSYKPILKKLSKK